MTVKMKMFAVLILTFLLLPFTHSCTPIDSNEHISTPSAINNIQAESTDDAYVSVFASVNSMCVDIEENSQKPNPERIAPNSSRPYIALTFDDGPDIKNTSRILDILDKYAARGTFFVLGNRIDSRTSPLLSRMIASESEIGSHSWDHPILSNLTSDAVSNQFERTDDKVYSATGSYPTLIRPPYGAVSKQVLSAVSRPIVLWSVDPKDWESRDAKMIVDAVLSTVESGDIVLLHDIYPSTADALEEILQVLSARDYQFVTVSQLLALRGDTVEAGKKYY